MGRMPFIFPRQKTVSCFVGRLGLGNRILPIGCALNLAKESDYRLVVYWQADKTVGKTRFDDLFETTALPFELVEGYEPLMMEKAIFVNSEQFKFPQKAIFKLFRSLSLSQYDKKFKFGTSKEGHNASFPNYRKILIIQKNLFRDDYDMTWLKPLPHITARIVELKNKFPPNTVGVHFRGTDWCHTPPVEKMIVRMRAEVELDPDVKFFFASDGDKRGKVIEDIFGDRLITNKTHYGRRTLQGQEGAVVDLFGLASTSRIIAPSYSSFTSLASILGNKPLLRIKPGLS